MDKDKPSTFKLSAEVSTELNINFTQTSAWLHKFKKGFKKDAMTEALKMWIWLIHNDPELYKELRESIKDMDSK